VEGGTACPWYILDPIDMHIDLDPLRMDGCTLEHTGIWKNCGSTMEEGGLGHDILARSGDGIHHDSRP
jgi:hypothetical protein